MTECNLGVENSEDTPCKVCGATSLDECFGEQVLAAIKPRGTGAYDIAAAIGSDYDRVTNTLIQLEKRGKVVACPHDGECDWMLR